MKKKLLFILISLLFPFTAISRTDMSPVELQRLKKKAESGDPEALYNLGMFYYSGGDSIKNDPAVSFSLWIRAAGAGYNEANNGLGMLYENGCGVEKNIDKAASFYEKAMKGGSKVAQYNLGNLFLLNNLPEKGLPLLTELAEEGDQMAQMTLVKAYTAKKDFTKAFPWNEKLAAAGNSNGQFLLGVMYKNGLGCTQNYVKAAEFLDKASRQGNAAAMTELGNLYMEGKGVERDFNHAARLFASAIQSGDINAYCNMGLIYIYGAGVAKDMEKGKAYLAKGAQLGDPEAQYQLALYLFNENPPQLERAMNFLLQAASQGHEGANDLLQRAKNER